MATTVNPTAGLALPFLKDGVSNDQGPPERPADSISTISATLAPLRQPKGSSAPPSALAASWVIRSLDALQLTQAQIQKVGPLVREAGACEFATG